MTKTSVVFWKIVAPFINFHEDWSSKFIWNVCNLQPEYTVSQHRRDNTLKFALIHSFSKGRNDRPFEYGNEPSGSIKCREIPYLENSQTVNYHYIQYNWSLRQQRETYMHGSYFNFVMVNYATAPSGRGLPHYQGFTITLRNPHSVGVPLDEWSARLRDIVLTTNNTKKRPISMPSGDSKPQSRQASSCRPAP
jgi:hypothetical protein